VVSGLGVVTPWTDLPRQAAAPHSPAAPPDDSWFDVTTRLGPRGYRYLPAASAYLLAAARAAVADAGGIDHVAADARAAVVATNHAATRVLDGMDDTVTREGSDGLSPALAPYFSINTYVGRVATEYETRAFAVTLTSPAVAGLDALALAATSLARGRAGVLVVGTTEARLPAGHRASGADETGAAALVLEPAAAARARGARVHGTVRARTLYIPDGDTRPPSDGHLAAALDALLKDGDRAPLTVHLVADDSPVAELTAHALKPHGTVRRAPLGAGCLAPALRLVQSLASHGERHLVAVAQGTGHVGLALVTTEETA
jgi:3-oxoacyl-[acyl-carrier-protein] synthase II